MGVVHITEEELARDTAAVLDRVQAGTEVVIERDALPVAVLRSTQPRRRQPAASGASLPG